MEYQNESNRGKKELKLENDGVDEQLFYRNISKEMEINTIDRLDDNC